MTAVMFLVNASADADWRDAFRAYSITHFAVFVGFALCVVVVCKLGLRYRSTQDQGRFELWLAASALGIWLVGNAWQFLPGNYQLGESLPLHVCDWMGLVAPAAMATQSRRLIALVYFSGLGLSTQSFITPVLQEGPTHLFFWIYWLTHAVLVGFPFYFVFVRGYRPTWRDYGFVVAVIVAYGIVILPFDLLLNVNYGYVGRSLPERTTIIDALGPWPWRLAALAPLACLGLFLPLAPWLIARRVRGLQLPAELKSPGPNRSSISGT